MARIFTSGAELNSNTSKMEVGNGANGITVASSPIRTGDYSWRALRSTNGTAYGIHSLGSQTNRNLWIRFYLYITTLPAAEIDIFQITSGGGLRVAISLKSTGELQLEDDGGSQVGSDSSALSTGQWYLIEVSMDQKTSSGNITAEAKLNGSSFASGTYAASVNSNDIRFGGCNSSTYDLYLDDIAVNDDSGSFQNSWIGSGIVNHYYPSSAGDSNDWTRAGADSGNNWDQVNEVTPNDATDYNTSNTAGHEDLFNITDTGSEIGSGDTINVVSVNARYTGAGASSNGRFVLEIEATSGGTIEQSATILSYTSTWGTNTSSSATNMIPPLTLYDLPGASTTPWSKSTLDTAQIGYNLTVAQTNACQISTVYLCVDSIPTDSVPENYGRFFHFFPVLGMGALFIAFVGKLLGGWR